MKSTIFLRIASVLTFIHCVLHTVGGVLGSPKHGQEEITVIDMMKSHSFDMMGSMRSYWDFFFGYGIFVTITLFVQAVLFWQLSSIVKAYSAVIKPIILLFCLSFMVSAVVAWHYFFIGPAVTELLIALCLGATFATASSTRSI